jgi:hypothetical protein
MEKITLLNVSSNSLLQTLFYMSWKWIRLCTFQICGCLVIDASIAAGIFRLRRQLCDVLYSYVNDDGYCFVVERSFLNRMIFCWVLGFTRDNTNLVKGCCETIGG